MQNVSCFALLQDVAPILNHLVALVQDLESKKTTSTTSAGPTASTTTVPPPTASTSVGSQKTIVGQMKNDSHLHHNVPPAMLIARDSQPMSHLHEEYKYDVCKSQGSDIPFFFKLGPDAFVRIFCKGHSFL